MTSPTSRPTPHTRSDRTPRGRRGIVGPAPTSAYSPRRLDAVVDTSESVAASDGLVVDGEQIADPELWTQAKSEGSHHLYSGYTENTEAEVLNQFKADTGLKVNVVRLTSNRLYERIFRRVRRRQTQGRRGPHLRLRLRQSTERRRPSSSPTAPETAINLHEDVVFDDGVTTSEPSTRSTPSATTTRSSSNRRTPRHHGAADDRPRMKGKSASPKSVPAAAPSR